jgi:[glutamine synthetase] adenylyltransferase / [glutamine synthetase]-adenylyl-L-tyrosine phosphorylase
VSRAPSPRTTLVRTGFVDLERSARALVGLGDHADAMLRVLAETADPDLALDRLVDLGARLDETDPGAGTRMLDTLAGHGGAARRLLHVLGASSALGEHVLRHPHHWTDLTDDRLEVSRPATAALRSHLLEAVGADLASPTPVASGEHAALLAQLRVQYRRLLMQLAARDLAHGVGVDDVAAELSDLAAAVLEAALAVARAQLGEETAARTRLAIIAMGKCGGHELNYVSDVDVVFVAEPADDVDDHEALRVATQLATQVMKACSDHTADGTIWPVDAALRPEGKAGPLVRTLASHHGYYERWAKTWEFQALLKARPVAGDAEVGRRYVEMMNPLVWQASTRDGFVTEVQAMRRRVVDHIPAAQSERQLKLGPGGLRDVEFAVQLLQMVHGRLDEHIRMPTTLSALAELTGRGYIGRKDGQQLFEAYKFLRTVEHRLQLYHLRRTALVPEDEPSLRRLGRSLGHLKRPVIDLEEALRSSRREVRRLHEKLFYRPLLAAVTRTTTPGDRLSTRAAEDRLAALGYADPQAAIRHLAALSDGVSRTAAIQRTLLPVMLEWFADAPDPDAGLLGFRKISETLGRTPWYLSLLRDEGEVAQRMARILGASRYATDLLEREPEGVKLLARSELVPRDRGEVQSEMLAAARRQDTSLSAIGAVRSIRRRELLRIAATDLADDQNNVEMVGEALTALTLSTLQAALEVATRSVEHELGHDLPTRMAIISLGRLGGHEVGYGSDADVMFVHDPLEGASAEEASKGAHAVANELRRLLAVPGSDPALEVDADLRPEGKQGPLARTLESYASYYAKWSKVWEAQALLRAEAVVGDPEVSRRFVELIDPLRFPDGGLSDTDVREVRRIKARVDNERIPRGADPATHFKLGRGGLGDVEWTVQLLQMRHAHEVPALRTPRTLAALRSAVEAELIDETDARVLEQGWLTVSRIRNVAMLVRGRPSDQLARDHHELAALALLLGYPPGEADRLANDYLRITRRAHGVVERVFWA